MTLKGCPRTAGVAALTARHTSGVERSGFPLASPVVLEARDTYGQRVASVGPRYAVVLQTWTDNSTGFEGATRAPFAGGRATFGAGALTLTKRPGAAVALRFAAHIGGDTFRASLRIDLRRCARGEEDSGDTCLACPGGSYAFAPGERCRACPKNTVCSGGAAVVAKPRYWRSAPDAAQTRTCRYPAHCPGGVDLWGNGTVVSSDAQCRRHHVGPLCALCETGYQLNAASGRCFKCNESGRRQGALVLSLVGGAVLVFGLAVFSVARKFRDLAMIVSAMMEAASDALIVVAARAKVLLVFFQILGSLQLSFPAVRLPPVMLAMSRRAAALGLDPSQFVAQTCVGDVDYLHALQFVTAGPLAVTVALFGVYKLWERLSRAAAADVLTARKSVYLAFLLTTYAVYSTSSSVVIRALQCDSDFRDARDSPFYGESYLYADYSVSCGSRRYRLHRAYAIVMVFVFPLGIPLLYFGLLLGAKATIAPADVGALAERIVADTAAVPIEIARERENVARMLRDEGRRRREHGGRIGRFILSFEQRKREEDLLLAIKRGEVRQQSFEYLAAVADCEECEAENRRLADTPLARAKRDSFISAPKTSSKATRAAARRASFRADSSGAPAAPDARLPLVRKESSRASLLLEHVSPSGRRRGPFRAGRAKPSSLRRRTRASRAIERRARACGRRRPRRRRRRRAPSSATSSSSRAATSTRTPRASGVSRPVSWEKRRPFY